MLNCCFPSTGDKAINGSFKSSSELGLISGSLIRHFSINLLNSVLHLCFSLNDGGGPVAVK